MDVDEQFRSFVSGSKLASESEGQESTVVFCDEVGRGPLAGPVVACAVIGTVPTNLLAAFELALESFGIQDSKKISKKNHRSILKKLGVFGSDDESPGLDSTVLDSKVPESGVSEFGELSVPIESEQSGEISISLKWKIISISPKEIDEINILQASLLGMFRAADFLIRSHVTNGNSLNGKSTVAICIDGPHTPKQFTNYQAIDFLKVESFVKGDGRVRGIGLASLIAKVYRDDLMEELGAQYPGYGLEDHAGYPTVKHKQAIADLGVLPIHRKTFKGVREWVEMN